MVLAPLDLDATRGLLVALADRGWVFRDAATREMTHDRLAAVDGSELALRGRTPEGVEPNVFFADPHDDEFVFDLPLDALVDQDAVDRHLDAIALVARLAGRPAAFWLEGTRGMPGSTALLVFEPSLERFLPGLGA